VSQNQDVSELPATRPHLLLGGWYKPGTGFTRVLLAMLPYLRQHFRITWLGVGYQGEPLDLEPPVLPPISGLELTSLGFCGSSPSLLLQGIVSSIDSARRR